jgi:pimeloyl-ACP methyl ester carboxylesterase
MANSGCAVFLLMALLVAGGASAQRPPVAEPLEPESIASDGDDSNDKQAPVLEPDRAAEQRVAALLRNSLDDSEIVELGPEGQRFIALYRRQTLPVAKGAVVILHGVAGQPDARAVIAPLRRDFPVAGWSTLAIQMPILAAGTPLSEWGGLLTAAQQRVQAAVAFLRAEQLPNIVVIGHGTGALTGLVCCGGGRIKGVAAVVAISLPSGALLTPPHDVRQDLESLRLPFLDVYASRDVADVLSAAPERQVVLRPSVNAHRQIVIEGADHWYTGVELRLAKLIRGWLQKILLEPASG